MSPIVGFAGLGGSWSGIQDWADQSFPEANTQQEEVARAAEEETNAAGGVRFCCYGAVSTISAFTEDAWAFYDANVDVQIHNAQIRLVGVMSELHAKVDPNEPYNSFSVSKDGIYFMLKFPDGSLFAQLNEALAGGLDSLESLSSIEIRAFAETKSVYNALTRAKKPGEAKLKVDINIYGSVEDADTVGEKLSSAKVFLQDPEHAIANVEYANPHLIPFPGFDAAPIMPAHHHVGGPGGYDRQKDVEHEQDSFKHTLTSIYLSLKRARDLQGVHGSSHLLTTLLEYMIYWP